jgi:hypothetical protein
MRDKLVTVARFADYIEAELARQLLADHGIEAVATGEHASNLYSIPAIEGPELKVMESNARRAKQILESAKHEQENETQDQQDQEQ